MVEAVCLAFSVVPSQLRTLYWQYSLADIRVKLKLFLGQEQAHIMQHYDTMALILNQAFGGGNTKSTPVVERSAGTLDEMKSAFAGIF